MSVRPVLIANQVRSRAKDLREVRPQSIPESGRIPGPGLDHPYQVNVGRPCCGGTTRRHLRQETYGGRHCVSPARPGVRSTRPQVIFLRCAPVVPDSRLFLSCSAPCWCRDGLALRLSIFRMGSDQQTERVVAHLVPWPGVGGTEHATLRIARAIAPHGFRSVFFCLSDAPDVHTLFRDAGFRTFDYHGVGLSLRRPAAYVLNNRALARALRDVGADILHCADVQSAVYGAPAGPMAGIPVVCHVRNRDEPLTVQERLPLRAVKKFVFVSKDTWRESSFKVKAERGQVLYDGVEISPPRDALESRSVRQDLGLPLDAPIVGMVARLSPQKDFFTLARAATHVLRVVPNARFVIVGDISQSAGHRQHYDAVRSELLRLGVLDSFVFTGFRSDVSRVLKAFDVFVLSTHFEGLPLVVLEAMAAGLATVATAVNGIPEVIRDSHVGLLFAAGDDVQLADHLIRLLSNRSDLERLGRTGREFVRETFSVDSFAANLVCLYDDVLRVESKAAPRVSG